MTLKTVVTNAQIIKSKQNFLLHLLTGCLIFYGLVINTNPSIQQGAKMENTQNFFTETISFNDSVIEKNQFFDFYIPAPYIGRNAMKQESITTEN